MGERKGGGQQRRVWLAHWRSMRLPACMVQAKGSVPGASTFLACSIVVRLHVAWGGTGGKMQHGYFRCCVSACVLTHDVWARRRCKWGRQVQSLTKSRFLVILECRLCQEWTGAVVLVALRCGQGGRTHQVDQRRRRSSNQVKTTLIYARTIGLVVG